MCNCAEVILKVSQVGAGFEVVAATIGDDAAVGYVHFADAPAVEACFVE